MIKIIIINIILYCFMKNKFLLFLCFTTVICVHAGIFININTKEEHKVSNQKQRMIKISFNSTLIEVKKQTKIEKRIEKTPLEKNSKQIKKVIKKSPNKILPDIKKTNKHTSKKLAKKIVKKQEKKIRQEKRAKNIIKNMTEKVMISSKIKQKIKENYLSKIQKMIEENKYYPKKAKRLKQEGIVIVEFNIHKNGSIHSLYLKSKSSYKRLNKAALATIKQIKQFAPIPNELNKNTLKITVPISFIIRNS